ncbi:unnamed protein product [Spirodela intermedia]|uniref:Uncharacterized protein n=1 Tax=Spirodela intermedia TaxID=51605 RepID=A0A7I8JT44_SPIIN|nr:unnamed protein product [Spirodela intermedia]CAA6673289.1 unnamed protein product [Spirodela intermedia]
MSGRFFIRPCDLIMGSLPWWFLRTLPLLFPLFTKFSGLLTTFGFASCIVDLAVLTKKTKGGLIILVVYVDDIFVIKSDEADISITKVYLQQHLNIFSISYDVTCIKLDMLNLYVST